LDIEVVDEPKGVLLTDLGYNRFPLSDILGGYLVIDFGGGTCDFALMKRGEVVRSWGDMGLGGRLFDDLFYQWFGEQNPGALEQLKKQNRDFYVWSYCCRRLKEDFSETVAKNPNSSVNAEVGRFGFMRNLTVEEFLLKAQNYSPSDSFIKFHEKLGVKISDILLNKPTNLLEWFKTILIDKIENTNDIKAVSLSGGSSKWFFVKQFCLDLLKIDPAKILSTPNPFGAISEGLSILPTILIELETKKEIISNNKDSFIEKELISFIQKSIKNCTDKIIQKITINLFDEKIVQLLKNLDKNQVNINLIENQILKIVQTYKPELTDLINTDITNEIITINTILQAKIHHWLDQFGLRLEGLLPSNSDLPETVEINNLIIGDQLARPLLMMTNGLVSAWTSIIVATICGGGGMAILASGPLGLFLGVIGGLTLSGLGLLLGQEKLRQYAKRQTLPRFVVKAIITEKNIQLAREKFKDDLSKQLDAAYSTFIKQYDSQLNDIITNEIEQIGILNII
jgi:hypothetical protein